ncbi:hypothetical protein HMN09_00929900 [Mycena chlorophos]|uniref:DUF6534 domain-containing protein n=1 Tax=Mycena chlorophos TaxID=658473 RepID=A0A8H6SMB8_MYCCL|nr:hypothetical protein HMN09_00929900 [Mycena chlorophos]
MSAGSSSPAAAITLPDMSPTLGALLVGTLLSCVLWGILTTQVYLYFGRFAEDRRAMKILVAVVWTLELVHAISISHTTYTYLVLDYTDPLKLQGKMPATLAVSVLVGAIITATVQGYFSFRIWVLAPNAFFKLVSGVLWLSAAAYLFGSLADTILSIEAPNIATFLSKYGKLMLYPTILNLANDLLITAALLTILIWTRQQGIARTALLVDRLILWTIETGMITSGFSCLNLAFYDTEPNNFIWIAMQIIKARLFANTLLATLNSRTAFLAAMGPSTRDTDTTTGPSAAGARSPDHLQFTSNIDIGLSQLSSGFSSKYSSTWG